MSAKEKKLHKQIITVLKDKNLYEQSDEILIEELIFLHSVIAKSKESIVNHGILVNVRTSGDPLYQVNQAVSVYRDSVKSMITICTKHGITPHERSKLKLIEKKSEFNLNDFLNEN